MRAEQASRSHQEESHSPEYRVYKHSLYEEDDRKRNEVVVPRLGKHLKVKPRALRNSTKEHSEDSEGEEYHEYSRRRYLPLGKHGPKEENLHKHRQQKNFRQLYSSASDLRDHNNYEYKSPFTLYVPKDGRRRSPQIPDRFSRFNQNTNIGDFEGGRSIPRRCHIQQLCGQVNHQHQLNEKIDCLYCKRPEVCTSCVNSKTESRSVKKDDPLDEVIEKLKSDFLITPKPKVSLSADGKGLHVYVPLLEEKDPKEIVSQLDSLYKNINNKKSEKSEASRRILARKLKRIIEKYFSPDLILERDPYNSSRTVEEKLLCETFFKKCDQEGIQPQTTFKTPAYRYSITDILDEITKLPIRETDSEFLVKFEEKLREKNCICYPSPSKNFDDDRLDHYIDNLIGVLKRN